ncbi:ribosome recycling factor [Spartinivicinus poritis]|uniref:Ribosome-recycling factor n=1 Tax=Spartinivicinus poritis TaxID=2994640 RepID=A0ABT5U278_9GAMM|nr:ribosome recycling factor [Spartinivicinus sp. A2-2]MDE1460397.1 ribosome recycling factor [Spartinivicinus sp. A2-2]
MINEIKSDAKTRMKKSVESLDVAFAKIRTGRAHPSLLDSVVVSYYGADTPLNQVANISVEDGRTLSVSPWEKQLVPDIEKAILKSDLGLNPNTAGDVIRIPLPPLTEETRKNYIKQAKSEAEGARVAVRNIRRDAISELKSLLKDKEISEDEERKAHDEVQKITDQYVAEVDKALQVKEAELMEI